MAIPKVDSEAKGNEILIQNAELNDTLPFRNTIEDCHNNYKLQITNY